MLAVCCSVGYLYAQDGLVSDSGKNGRDIWTEQTEETEADTRECEIS